MLKGHVLAKQIAGVAIDLDGEGLCREPTGLAADNCVMEPWAQLTGEHAVAGRFQWCNSSRMCHLTH